MHAHSIGAEPSQSCLKRVSCSPKWLPWPVVGARPAPESLAIDRVFPHIGPSLRERWNARVRDPHGACNRKKERTKRLSVKVVTRNTGTSLQPFVFLHLHIQPLENGIIVINLKRLREFKGNIGEFATHVALNDGRGMRVDHDKGQWDGPFRHGRRALLVVGQ